MNRHESPITVLDYLSEKGMEAKRTYYYTFNVSISAFDADKHPDSRIEAIKQTLQFNKKSINILCFSVVFSYPAH